MRRRRAAVDSLKRPENLFLTFFKSLKKMFLGACSAESDSFSFFF